MMQTSASLFFLPSSLASAVRLSHLELRNNDEFGVILTVHRR